MVILGSKENLCTSLMEQMNTLRKDENLIDVCIKVDDNQVKAHKSVLASGSGYFYSCFVGPLKTEDRMAEVDLSTIALDGDSVEAVVDFLYTGQIDIHDENLEAILKLATFLLINPLEELCIEYMEQNRDLSTYLFYYVLSVDYMVAQAEDVMIRSVKQRFHDWFIHLESTATLSAFHLQRLIVEYNIFEHCSQIDRLTFLVDWVLNGKTERHEELVCKILDGEIVPKPYDEPEIDAKQQSDDNEQSVEEPCIKTVVQKDGESVSQKEKDSVQPQPEDVNVTQIENSELDNNKVSQSNQESQKNNGESQNKELQSDKECKVNNVGKERLDYDILKKVEKIKNKLEISEYSKEFGGKCMQVIDNLTESFYGIQQHLADEMCAEVESHIKQNQGSDVGQVLIAIAPKQILKDFYQEIQQDDRVSDNNNDAIFDICVYIPHKMTWYYFGEGKHKSYFKEMSRSKTMSTLNFCMLDNLCCVSNFGSSLKMYMMPLKDGNLRSIWLHTSHNDLDTDIQVPDPDNLFNDLLNWNQNSYKVKVFSRDGENMYLVLKKRTKENQEKKVQFKCFWSLFLQPWEFLFETPYITEEEDARIGSGSFNVVVSAENKELFIAAKGKKLHIFVGDLQNRGSELRHHVLEGAANMPNVKADSDEPDEVETNVTDIEDMWKQVNDFHIMLHGNHLTLVEEVQDDEECLHYRNRTIDITGDMSIERSEYQGFDTPFPSPSEYEDLLDDTPVKYFWSGSDGTSLWIYLSDGKFETSLTEMRPDVNGVMDFIEHTPPAFSAITMMAAGMVKSEHLTDLKPITNFLLEK